jgi:DNA-binding SARP family transcriptional activator
MRFGLLGPIQVFDGDQEVLVPGRMRRTILAALLLNADSVVSLDHLADLLWAQGPPASATASLYNHVNHLRQALGEGGARITAVNPGYRMRIEPGELDARMFAAECADGRGALAAGHWEQAADRYRSALALWRGRPLADIPGLRDHPRVLEFEENRWEALRRRIEADLHLGRHAALIDELGALVAEQPLREAFHGQLMLALYRCARSAEALDVFSGLRKRLVGELGVEPSASILDLYRGISSADAALAAWSVPAGPDQDAGGRRDGAPRQLPADTPAFTGRAQEIDRLVAFAETTGPDGAPSAPVLCAIDGMGGVGKTALAVHAAYRLARAYPDGQLFLDLHGYTQGRSPRSAGQAVNWLLRSLGVAPEQIPADDGQAAALYRRRLADSRTLIVLDNAAAEAQVLPLLPDGGSCLVLVTSRRRLRALAGAHAVSLDLLPPPDAVALLRVAAGPDRIPHDGPLPGELAELCGRLPLALRIAGALLRHRPNWPPEHLAELLRDQSARVPALSDGDRELAAVFDLSYANLDERHRLSWRRLGLVPGPDLDAYAAAALLDVAPETAAELLRDLVDHNLLLEYRPGRYRLHDLVRAHVRALVAADPAAERDAAVDRLLHYYAHTAQAASTPVAGHPRSAPGGPAPAHAPALPDPDAARAWLRAEHAGLDAAFAHAVDHGLAGHAIALAAGLAEVLRVDGPFTRALEVHRTAAETAERAGDLVGRATALTDLARVQYLSGDYADAGDGLARALEIRRALGDRQAEAGALVDLGRVRYLTGDRAGATSTLTHALELHRALGDRRGEAEALHSLGYVQSLTRDPAFNDSLASALELYRALGHRQGEADALNTLGLVRLMAGAYAVAGDELARALEIHRALGSRQGEATALNYLGIVRQSTGDHPGAADALTRALEIYRVLGNRRGEAEVLNCLGEVWEATGDLPGASDAHVRALEIYRALDNRIGEAYCQVELGRVLNATEDYAGAAEALTHALEIYRAVGDRSNEGWALNHYAATLAATGRRPEAVVLYQQALARNRELNKPDDEAIALEGLAECHLSDGDTEAAADRFHQALAIFERIGAAPDARRVRERLDEPAARQVAR